MKKINLILFIIIQMSLSNIKCFLDLENENLSHSDICNINAIKYSGRNLNETDSNNMTLLHRHLYNNKPDIARLLIYAGANTNLKDIDGCIPINIAIAHNYKDIVELLIKKGALNNLDREVQRPLHIAIICNNFELVQLLINSGADVNESDREGRRALHFAAMYADSNITKLLIESGATMNIFDVIDLDPLFTAIDYDNLSAIKTLYKYGYNIQRSIKTVNPNNINQEAVYNSADFAASRNHFEIVKWLISQGVPASLETINKFTELNRI